jgi:hypothetical protein
VLLLALIFVWLSLISIFAFAPLRILPFLMHAMVVGPGA